MENRGATGSEFTEHQFGTVFPPGIERHYWTLARNRIIARELFRIGVSKAKILDVGCGKGIVLAYLRGHGFDIWGSELSSTEPVPDAEPYVKTGVGVTDLPGGFRNAFQVILLLDVIEHLEDSERFLNELACSFPNATHYLITVPARAELWSNYDSFHGHRKRYAMQDMAGLARNLGWEILRLGYFFRLLYIPAYVVTRLPRQRQTEIRPPCGTMAAVHDMVAHILALEARILPASLPGTSLILTAKAPRYPSSREHSA